MSHSLVRSTISSCALAFESNLLKNIHHAREVYAN